jgi:hypothetical protein
MTEAKAMSETALRLAARLFDKPLIDNQYRSALICFRRRSPLLYGGQICSRFGFMICDTPTPVTC